MLIMFLFREIHLLGSNHPVLTSTPRQHHSIFHLCFTELISWSSLVWACSFRETIVGQFDDDRNYRILAGNKSDSLQHQYETFYSDIQTTQGK